MYSLGIINGKVYQNQRFVKTNVYIQGEKIALISDAFLPSQKVIDAKGHEVIPGIIDPHVHFELDLGHLSSRDGFKEGSISALYGGVTSIIDFLEPVCSHEALVEAFEKRKAQAETCHVDFQFHATLKSPKGDLEAFILTMKSLGITTLKVFTTYSESGRRTEDAAIIRLLELSKKHNITILAHIENDELIERGDHLTFRDLAKSRQTITETTEALKMAHYVQNTGGKLYMVHLSSGHTLKQLKDQYPNLINQTFLIESCPQYMTFSSDHLKEDKGYLYTCAPPLRSLKEVNLLKDQIDDILCIGTDHCSFNTLDKIEKKLKDIPLGIGSIEHSFDVMRMHFGEKIIPKMTENVAFVHGLSSKGKIEEGYDADLLLYQPGLFQMKHHHGNTDYDLYEGLLASGRVIMTLLRGHVVMHDNQVNPIKGKWIKKEGLS